MAVGVRVACSRREARHGLSAFGELKYPADFKHFEWVNPDAPKGGGLPPSAPRRARASTASTTSSCRGDAAQGLDDLFDTLMVRAYDEPDAVYGLVASSAELAPDGSSVTFRLRQEAKFADGSPLTADDVVFSFKILKEKGHPLYRLQLKDVTKVEAPGRPSTVRYTFTGTQTRDLPLVVARRCRSCPRPTTRPGSSTRPRSIRRWARVPTRSATSSRAPSSPSSGARTTGPRISPVNKGRHNFDEVRYEYYRDRTAELESLKAGAYDLREEFTSRDWATAYDIPAVEAGPAAPAHPARREPLRRARVLPQHAPPQARRRARAQGARLCLRLRVDQQEHLLRAVQAHGELLRELRHEGRGQAGGR